MKPPTLASNERYLLTKLCAVALSSVVAAYGFWSWAQDGEVFKALLCLIAQGVAINCTIGARRAFAKDLHATGVGGLAIAAAAAYWSEQGLRHAWTADGSGISEPLTWAFCVIDPMIFWFTERVQYAKDRLDVGAMADAALQDFRRQTSPTPEPLRKPVEGLRIVARGQPLKPTKRTPSGRASPAAPENLALAKTLACEGMGIAEICRQTGVSRSKAKHERRMAIAAGLASYERPPAAPIAA